MNTPVTDRFNSLPDYAFPRLRTLLTGLEFHGQTLDMTIGEPKHQIPDFVQEILLQHLHTYNKYPPVDGTESFQEAAKNWLCRRYGLKDFEAQGRIIPLSGTREGIFLSTLALCPSDKSGKQANVLIPNPFYQCYAAATLACNANPIYLPATRETGYLPDYTSLSKDVLDQTAVVFICSPANPQGATADLDYWCAWLKLAEKHNFIIMADECYADIYCDQPPVGILQAVQHLGSDPNRAVAFHSLSKRSNLAGLRSGFVTSGAQTILHIRQLRAYGGAPCPLPTLAVSQRAWEDDAHVEDNRSLYRQKFAVADEIFADYDGYRRPNGGFFIWLGVENGEETAKKLWH
jgi:N-succinyldiaminopimelate aminotransferase